MRMALLSILLAYSTKTVIAAELNYIKMTKVQKYRRGKALVFSGETRVLFMLVLLLQKHKSTKVQKYKKYKKKSGKDGP